MCSALFEKTQVAGTPLCLPPPPPPLLPTHHHAQRHLVWPTKAGLPHAPTLCMLSIPGSWCLSIQWKYMLWQGLCVYSCTCKEFSTILNLSYEGFQITWKSVVCTKATSAQIFVLYVQMPEGRASWCTWCWGHGYLAQPCSCAGFMCEQNLWIVLCMVFFNGLHIEKQQLSFLTAACYLFLSSYRDV